jgi:hypothetical protein
VSFHFISHTPRDFRESLDFLRLKCVQKRALQNARRCPREVNRRRSIVNRDPATHNQTSIALVNP